ncbi:hypothetical protein [Streptomyces sp. CA-251247]|uniref:hypothetical protein n=1 Tax=Streptomyces sp. CA-251247 TaxID=3240062 RepID=UPI003D938B8D
MSEPTVDPQMPQKVMVRKTYEAMWAEQMKAYRKANPAGTQSKKYAVLNALSLFEADLAHMRKHGTVIRGTLGHEPTVRPEHGLPNGDAAGSGLRSRLRPHFRQPGPGAVHRLRHLYLAHRLDRERRGRGPVDRDPVHADAGPGPRAAGRRPLDQEGPSL